MKIVEFVIDYGFANRELIDYTLTHKIKVSSTDLNDKNSPQNWGDIDPENKKMGYLDENDLKQIKKLKNLDQVLDTFMEHNPKFGKHLQKLLDGKIKLSKSKLNLRGNLIHRYLIYEGLKKLGPNKYYVLYGT